MLFLGIDGGGTKTKVYVINQNKKVIYKGSGGPSSIDTVTNQETLKSINNALINFFNKSEFESTTFTAIFAGLGGVPSKKEQLILEKIIKKVKGASKNTLIIARSDMENALASGLLFDEGITLIAGTGMVAYGKNKHGITARAGGLGYKEGDLGSSYSLGKMAIQAVARALDKRYPITPFTEELINHLKVKTPADIARLSERWYEERTKVAALAPYVTKHADLNDKFAKKICDQMSYELVLSVQSVYNQLKLDHPTLVVVGSLGNVDGYFKNRLHEQIHEFAPDLKIISPQVDPAYAAALLAHHYFYL